MTDALLTYRFSTAPAPLQASGPSQLSPGMINLSIAPPPGREVYADKIVVGVPVGTGPADFSTVTPTLTPSTTWWTASGAVMGTGADIGLDPADDPAANLPMAIITVNCGYLPHRKIDYRLVFSLATTAVNPHAGPFRYRVVESSSPTEGDYVLRTTDFTLTKAPAELYLTNLVTVPAGPVDPPVPRTRFFRGEAIQLRWESNGSRFAVHQAGRSGPVWTGVDTSCTLPGVATDTTFTLLATMDGTPGTVATSITVTVVDPASTPRTSAPGTLTVLDGSTLTGEARLDRVAASGRITVAGTSRLRGVTAPSVAVSGPADLLNATLSATTVTGALSGSLGLTSATVGNLLVNTVTSGMASRPLVLHQLYQSSSDGLVVGTVRAGANAVVQVATTARAVCTGVATVDATGGNSLVWKVGTRWTMWGATASLLLFVPKGRTFRVEVLNRFLTQAPMDFRYVPLARDAVLQEVGPAAEPPAPAPVPAPRPRPPRRIDRVLDAFAGLAGDRFTPELRRRTAAALTDLLGGQP